MDCENCGNEIKEKYGSGRFCSSKCAKSFSTRSKRDQINKRVSETIKEKYDSGEFINPNKGKPGRKHSEETKRRISIKGVQASKDRGWTIDREKFISEWLSGEHNSKLTESRFRMIREYLIQKCEEKCPQCGWGEKHPTKGTVPLQIDHVDGNHWNNSPENLRVLCPNCHSLTENWGRLNPLGKHVRKRIGQSGGI